MRQEIYHSFKKHIIKQVREMKMEKTREELNEIFNSACENGDFNTIRNMIKQYTGYVNVENNDGYGFKKSCEKGYVNIIDYLVNTKELVNHIGLDFQENIGFFIACNYRQTEIVRYYFKYEQYHLKKGLINHLYIKSCEYSDTDMFKVLKEFDLLKHINPEWNKCQGFKEACKNETTQIINDIIFTLNLPLSEELKEWLKNERYERVINIFKKRDMYNGLKTV